MRFSQGMSASKVTTSELSALEYDITDSAARVRFLQDREGGGQRICVAEMKVNFVDISFYAKQHLQKQPTLLECGIVICGPMVQTFLIPTGRSRMAGNGSVAVKYYDASKPIHEEDIEKYERVGIRLPSGVFTYAFFEAPYLARAEDPRRGALFLIDPSMIVVQYAMADEQKQEFQTFGGKKVLYFDVLDAPNLKERKEEIKRCKEKGDQQRIRHEEADKKWEDEMAERLRLQTLEGEKPKISKKAKQKAKQGGKKGPERSSCSIAGPSEASESISEVQGVDEASEERQHKLRQAERKTRAEEEIREEKEEEAQKKKLEAAEVKRVAEEEASRMLRVKSLLQKVQCSLGKSEAFECR